MDNEFDKLGAKQRMPEFMPTPYETLLHRVFFQTDAGKELMLKWREDLVNLTLVDVNSNPSDLQVGHNLGYIKFKQDIIRIVNRINSGGK
jgi:hypothetical protein